MTQLPAVRWLIGLAGLAVAILVFFWLSIFVSGRQLAPTVTAAELGPIDLPAGEPTASGALLFASDRSGSYEIYVGFPDGPADGAAVALTSDPAFDSWRPRLSPDRRTVLFYRNPVGTPALDPGNPDPGNTDPSQTSLWMVAASGGEPVEVLPPSAHGWTTHGHAEWSPLGQELAMVAASSEGSQLWVTSLDGRAIRAVFDEPGSYADPSWSPDGKRLLYIGCAQAPCSEAEREVFATFATGDQQPIQITNDVLRDAQPQLSPDGLRVAVRSQVVPPLNPDDDLGQGVWQVRIVPIGQAAQAALVPDQGFSTGSPTWRDNDTLVFGRSVAGGVHTDIFSFHVNTGELVELVAAPSNERDPAS